MSDTPNDIDIEAERKLFEDTSTGFDLRHWEYDPTLYMERRTEAGLEGWLARARIAAEREREMVDLLREAQREGCTRCYSDAVGLPCCYPHSAQCLRITAALKKGPSDDQRRA